MEIIVIIAIIIAIVIFISDANEKERQREEEAERKREAKKRIQEYEEKLKVLRETEFFKVVSSRIDELMKNDLIAQIKEKGNAYPATLYIKTTHISLRMSYEEGSDSVSFNSLGYKNLTGEQIRDFGHAMKVNGFEYCEPNEEYVCTDYLSPSNDYWQPIIEKFKAEYDSQFTDPF